MSLHVITYIELETLCWVCLLCANRDVRLNSRDNFDDFELWCPRQDPLANYLKISPPLENVMFFIFPLHHQLNGLCKYSATKCRTSQILLNGHSVDVWIEYIKRISLVMGILFVWTWHKIAEMIWNKKICNAMK